LKDFEPLKTLDEVEAMLRAKGINYQKGVDTLDATTIPSQLVQAIVALPPGEVFVLPTGQVVLINRVRETRVEPYTGEAAVQHAINLLKNQRTQEAVMKQMAALVKQAEGEVRYNKAYAPPAKGPAPKAADPKAAPSKGEQPPAPKA
jgi:peptidyl-prolyl cis-trans isomerase C